MLTAEPEDIKVANIFWFSVKFHFQNGHNERHFNETPGMVAAQT